jgi:hypothetical protein
MADFAPQILLSDISMPGEDGYCLIRKLRARSPSDGGNIPAIALTAYAGAEDARLALEAGFSAHLSKPTDKFTLSHTIADLLNR